MDDEGVLYFENIASYTLDSVYMTDNHHVYGGLVHIITASPSTNSTNQISNASFGALYLQGTAYGNQSDDDMHAFSNINVDGLYGVTEDPPFGALYIVSVPNVYVLESDILNNSGAPSLRFSDVSGGNVNGSSLSNCSHSGVLALEMDMLQIIS